MNSCIFYLILVLTVAFVYQSSGEYCNEDNLKNCLNTMRALMDEHSKNESEINCGRVEEDGKCLMDGAPVCRKEQPLIAASTAHSLNYLNMICQPGTNQQPLLLKILPCLGKHGSQFKVCGQGIDIEDMKNENLENICKKIEGALCLADVGSKICGKNGELFAKSVENGLNDTYKDVCTASVHQSSSEYCNENTLKKCLNTIQALIDEHFSSMKKSENDLNIYCGRVEEDGKCLIDGAAACRKEHPLIAASTASLLNYLNMICQPGTNQRSMYLKILPCFEHNESEFKICVQSEDYKHIKDEDLKNLCAETKSALCVADVSRKICDEDGDLFAKFIEGGLKDTYKEVCSGAYAIVFNVWAIACAVLIGFYFNK